MRARPAPTIVLAALLLAGCATPPEPLPAAPVLIFGEQHDQPDHQRQVAAVIESLAARGELGAVVIEMAERGRSTEGLERDADAARARSALAWSGWDWAAYAPLVMAAVRAGVPVLGGNLPRAAQRTAMVDATLDGRLDEPVRDRLAEAVREGHCGLLPAAQEPGMVRIQIARDRAMAQTVEEALARHPGRHVLLHTGAQHAARDRGVPLHLESDRIASHVVIFGEAAAELAADERRPARLTPQPDHCAGLRDKLAQPRPPA